MTSPAQLRASATYHARRKAQGWRKVTIWLSPEALEALERLAALHGSKDGAVAKALIEGGL